MKTKNSTVLNIRVRKKTLDEIEKQAEKRGYPNRSEYIREAVRRMNQPELKEKVLAEIIERRIESKYETLSQEEVKKRLLD